MPLRAITLVQLVREFKKMRNNHKRRNLVLLATTSVLGLGLAATPLTIDLHWAQPALKAVWADSGDGGGEGGDGDGGDADGGDGDGDGDGEGGDDGGEAGESGESGESGDDDSDHQSADSSHASANSGHGSANSGPGSVNSGPGNANTSSAAVPVQQPPTN